MFRNGNRVRQRFYVRNKDLHDKDATFIFATHFHEITDKEEITGLNNLVLKHMTVRHDNARYISI